MTTPAQSGVPLRIDMIRGDAALAQFSALLDTAFGVPHGSHYLDDFPVWDERHARSGDDLLKMGVFEGEKLVSSAAIRAVDMKGGPGGQLVPIGIVGAVATLDPWRGQGLASKTVALALDWAIAKGAAMAVLWGSEHSLYGQLGFLLRGKQARVPVSTFVGSSPGKPVQTGWVDGLFGILKLRTQGLALKDSDLLWVRAHRNVAWFWTGSPGHPTAYAALGKGIDLAGMVHEWGGDRNELFRIFATITQTHPGAELLGSPTLLAEYGLLPPDRTEPLCLAKVLKPGLAPQDFWLWGLDSA